MCWNLVGCWCIWFHQSGSSGEPIAPWYCWCLIFVLKILLQMRYMQFKGAKRGCLCVHRNFPLEKEKPSLYCRCQMIHQFTRNCLKRQCYCNIIGVWHWPKKIMSRDGKAPTWWILIPIYDGEKCGSPYNKDSVMGYSYRSRWKIFISPIGYLDELA